MTMNTMELDGYTAAILYNPVTDTFRGEIQGLNSGAEFQGHSLPLTPPRIPRLAGFPPGNLRQTCHRASPDGQRLAGTRQAECASGRMKPIRAKQRPHQPMRSGLHPGGRHDARVGLARASGADANPCHDPAGIGKMILAISAITRRRGCRCKRCIAASRTCPPSGVEGEPRQGEYAGYPDRSWPCPTRGAT